jgi:hypothetical protein
MSAAAAGTLSSDERPMNASASGDCSACPGNRTTLAEGSTSAADCISECFGVVWVWVQVLWWIAQVLLHA